MKSLILSLTILFLNSNAMAAVCEATNGWKVNVSPLHQPTRVPGNVEATIYDEKGEQVASFTADSALAGAEPAYGETDAYVLKVKSWGLPKVESFTWQGITPCPTCGNGGGASRESSHILFSTETQTIRLNCKSAAPAEVIGACHVPEYNNCSEHASRLCCDCVNGQLVCS